MGNLTADTALLDLSKVPTIVGDDPIKRFKQCQRLLYATRIPLYLVGDSGTGKTAIGQGLCANWAKKHNVPAYYMKLSQEDTKTTVMLGYRLVKGSLEVVPGLLARAAEEDAIVFVDEVTHSTHNMLLMLNAFDGQESTITIGDKVIDASKMKIIYGSNRSSHAGNIKVPQSFLNRTMTIPFEYPGYEDELKIALEVAKKDSLLKDLLIPDPVVRYVVAIVRDLREKLNKHASYPLSVRNMSKIALFLDIEGRIAKSKTGIDPYFTHGSNLEPMRRRISKAITGIEVADAASFASGPIREFLEFVTKIGVEEFKSIFLMGLNYWADTEGLDISPETIRQEMSSGII